MSLKFPISLVGKRGPSGTGLIDVYSGAAAAFSLRELSDSWAGQAVIRVQRSGGDQSDFTASEVSDGTMETWVQGGNAGAGLNEGVVMTWYDQSGNGFDATAVSSSVAPTVVANDAQILSQGLPAVDFDAISEYLQNAGSLTYSGGVSFYAVTNLQGISEAERLWCDDIVGAVGNCLIFTKNAGSSGGYSFNDNGAGYKHIRDNAVNVIRFSNQLKSLNFDDSNGNWVIANNGTVQNSGSIAGWVGPISSPNTKNFGLMAAGNGGQYGDGMVLELIIYPNDQSANRTGIETNIKTHYGI